MHISFRSSRKHDAEDVLFYCDPRYLYEAPHGRKAETYGVEMTYDGHVELLIALNDCKGRVVLSSYASDLSDNKLSSWRREEAYGKAHFSAIHWLKTQAKKT